MERHLEVVPGVLCGRCRELQQYLDVSCRILSEVKGNGDYIMEVEGAILSSQLNLGCLQQFGRATPGWSFSIKKIPGAVLKDKDHQHPFLLQASQGLSCSFPRYWGCQSTYTSTKLLCPIPEDIILLYYTPLLFNPYILSGKVRYKIDKDIFIKCEGTISLHFDPCGPIEMIFSRKWSLSFYSM